MLSRREFNTGIAAGVAGLAISSNARSYAQIIGANDRVNFGVIGLHSRAFAHLAALKANGPTSRLTRVADVESNIAAKFLGSAQKNLGYTPELEGDFRRLLEAKDVDVVTIATPDHWHAPMAILALKANKHVYVEKPCSYNPHEGELLIQARDKYKKLVQMGNQQRSSAHTIKIVGQIHDGLIGRAYEATGWYALNRPSIGIGRPAPVPSTLNWDLWQGPAPRTEYHDNYQPYNWHWFKRWGTGEALNNGTHEIDVCRWALGVEFPNSVQASGGRYAYKDDWQFYDTLEVSWKYDDKLISWDGHSCNSMKRYDMDRGSLILGTKGSVIISRDGYWVFDQGGNKIDEFRSRGAKTSSSDTTGIDDMTNAHFANFIAAVQHGEKLNSPIEAGNVTVTMLQLANYSWETNRTLKLDPSNGHIMGDPEAERMTRREYEKGWEPKV